MNAYLVRLGCLNLFVLLGGLGCTTGTEQAPDETPARLNAIAAAYRQATAANGQAPQDRAELEPFLPGDADPASVFQSARDGEPFVIIWGTDPNEGMDIKPRVIGYEKKGDGSNRYVFTVMGVVQMSESDFQSANFPTGHSPD